MAGCNQCGGKLGTFPVDLDVSRTPALIPMVLGCTVCGRPIRLLHKTTARPRELSRAGRNRVARAQRRLEMRAQ